MSALLPILLALAFIAAGLGLLHKAVSDERERQNAIRRHPLNGTARRRS